MFGWKSLIRYEITDQICICKENFKNTAFRKEVRSWLEENMKGSEHLRWSANWSTRENEEEYKFRRGLGEKLGKKGLILEVSNQ